MTRKQYDEAGNIVLTQKGGSTVPAVVISYDVPAACLPICQTPEVHMRRRLGSIVLSSLAVVGLAACPQRTAIWLVQPATSRELVFALGKYKGKEEPVRFYYLSVENCAPSSGQQSARLWMIGEGANGAPAVNPVRVRYGEVPSGFEAHGAAQPLKAGCYVTRTGGSGSVRFEVSPTGEVIERP